MVGRVEAGTALGGAAVGARGEVAIMQCLRQQVDRRLEGAAEDDGVVQAMRSRTPSRRQERNRSPRHARGGGGAADGSRDVTRSSLWLLVLGGWRDVQQRSM